MTMDAQMAQALREPFKPEQVGKLPKSWCKKCSDSPRRRCDEANWVKGCPECKGNHSTHTLHLDYVGHAAATDRLLQVDPEWSWEPFALDAQGLPLMSHGGMWIRLTIGGVTRPGYGDGKTVKEVIGDAIRNAAMRFGVALDLWAKEDLHAARTDNPDRDQAPPAPPPQRQRADHDNPSGLEWDRADAEDHAPAGRPEKPELARPVAPPPNRPPASPYTEGKAQQLHAALNDASTVAELDAIGPDAAQSRAAGEITNQEYQQLERAYFARKAELENAA